MLPVVVIVGAPNVGKSTLFNRLTKSRDALVADQPGVTRDRQYGRADFKDHQFIVVDTGGMGLDEDEIESLRAKQAKIALDEADIILFVVDGKAGSTAADNVICQELRKIKKPTFLVVNKIDGQDPDIALADFHQFGFAPIIGIAAGDGRGLNGLIETVFANFKAESNGEEEETKKDNAIKLALVGRPNVGKSTLINRMLGEERVVVYDKPGTTMDSIMIPFTHRNEDYILIDTAGIRRRARVNEALEKFSAIKTLQAINECHVACIVLNAHEEIAEQDLHIIGHVLKAGKSLVIAVNKWDDMTNDQKFVIKDTLARKLAFISYVEIFMISALHGSGVGDLYPAIKRAYDSATRELNTSVLTKLLEQAQSEHQLPLIRGRRIKLKFAHSGGANPPIIVFHGAQAEKTPESYRRFLANFYRKKLKLIGTPLLLEFKSSDNPFKGRKNQLTERQIRRKKRLMKFVKKK